MIIIVTVSAVNRMTSAKVLRLTLQSLVVVARGYRISHMHIGIRGIYSDHNIVLAGLEISGIPGIPDFDSGYQTMNGGYPDGIPENFNVTIDNILEHFISSKNIRNKDDF